MKMAAYRQQSAASQVVSGAPCWSAERTTAGKGVETSRRESGRGGIVCAQLQQYPAKGQ